MAQGILEVTLCNAKGLENTDFLNNMDPYVILSYGSQKRKSKVASGQGSTPEWNEKFTFNVNSGGANLNLKILDSDYATEDDFVGEVTISLEPVFHDGRVPPTSYNVVKDQHYRGSIRLGLTFTRKVDDRARDHGREESFGGWGESSHD